MPLSGAWREEGLEPRIAAPGYPAGLCREPGAGESHPPQLDRAVSTCMPGRRGLGVLASPRLDHPAPWKAWRDLAGAGEFTVGMVG